MTVLGDATVDPESPNPPFVQLADVLRSAITAGRVGPRGKLPSTRALAAEFKVSGVTAQRALDRLREEGWIFTTPRGSFAADNPPEPGGAQSAATGTEPDRVSELAEQVGQLAERVGVLEAILEGRGRKP